MSTSVVVSFSTSLTQLATHCRKMATADQEGKAELWLSIAAEIDTYRAGLSHPQEQMTFPASGGPLGPTTP